jgi:hypothetical protein
MLALTGTCLSRDRGEALLPEGCNYRQTPRPRFIYGARAFEGHELERRLQGDLHFCCSGLDIRESAVELSTSGHRAGQPACGKEQRRTYYGNVGSRSTPARFSIRCGRVGSARRFGGWVGWVVFVFLLSLAWCSHDGRGWREREGGEGEREREDESNRVEPSPCSGTSIFPARSPDRLLHSTFGLYRT